MPEDQQRQISNVIATAIRAQASVPCAPSTRAGTSRARCAPMPEEEQDEQEPGRGPELGGVMTFQQIAVVLHTTVQSVHASYARGLRKIAAHPQAPALWKLARQLAQARELREDGRPST